MENALIYQNPHWKSTKDEGLWPRSVMQQLISHLQLGQIQVLQGVRRSGKSTLFRLLINQLIELPVDPRKILYLNLDDPYFAEIMVNPLAIDGVIEAAEKLTTQPVEYIFLDEIQNLRQWEKYIKSMYDSQRFKKIFITGSNSQLLQGDYAKLLSGRYLTNMVYPLSLLEILNAIGFTSKLDFYGNKPAIMRQVDAMLRFGAYPEIVKCPDDSLKREILMNYYDTILLKDCVANQGIRDITAFKQLSHYLVSNPTTLYSFHSLAKIIDSTDITTKEFTHALKSSFAFHELYAYSFSVKKSVRRQKKVYWIDNGFPGSIAFQFSPNRGNLLENLVFSELVKAGYTVSYLRENHECDFIAQKKNQLLAIQVCWELTPRNKKREFAGLDLATAKLKVDDAVLITYDQKDDTTPYKTVPFWSYFTSS